MVFRRRQQSGRLSAPNHRAPSSAWEVSTDDHGGSGAPTERSSARSRAYDRTIVLIFRISMPSDNRTPHPVNDRHETADRGAH